MKIMAVQRMRGKPGPGSAQKYHPNLIVYRKMEKMVEKMLDKHGVNVKHVKSFLTKIPSVFTGADLISWIMENLPVHDQAEALHLSHQLACHGYLFPIDDHVLTVKNDGTFYRFQTPYFWPSNCWKPEMMDYAVYLCKRTMQNKAHLELEDFEAENLAKLQKSLRRRWQFVFMQAEAQYKVDKKRDRAERQIMDSQERAFWDVHKPVPGCVNTTDVDFRKVSRTDRECNPSSQKGSLQTDLEAIKQEIEMIQGRLNRNVIKTSKVVEAYIAFWDQRLEFDGFITPSDPPNPWIFDVPEQWLEDKACVEMCSRRVKRWSLSLEELLLDPLGRDNFMRFLEKEYAAENLRFYEAVQGLKYASNKDVCSKARAIYEEFSGPNAAFPVNVDSKIVEVTEKNLEAPTRWTFDEALEHIYKLMKNDSYQRFIRSDIYKELGARKKGSTKQSGFRSIVQVPVPWQNK